MTKNIKPRKAWADVGSHGGIFEFSQGPVAMIHPGLLHIYRRQLTPDLVPVIIRSASNEHAMRIIAAIEKEFDDKDFAQETRAFIGRGDAKVFLHNALMKLLNAL